MIGPFKGKYEFLSNFYVTSVKYNGVVYVSSEHAYQAAKPTDRTLHDYIKDAPTTGKAKRRGKNVPKREDWEQVKQSIMLDILRAKFSDPPLKQMLLATGEEELVEKNWWDDVYWGQIYDQEHQKWIGENNLGKLLMQVRHELQA